LFYRGRKINNYYQSYGGERFAEVIGKITGLDIERYVIVDMYAFIDIVNILGGIDITLDEDLVDPTYKVRDNGVWSTLYYKKGDYHFNGIETLRIARARHFTPVFSRDERQQKIIESLMKKISGLSVKNFNQIYDMLKTVIMYLETDMSIPEALNIMKDVRDIKKITKSVISTQNVLEQTYSNLLYLGLKEEEVDENFDYGAWILIPKDNDWSAIRSFIDQNSRGNGITNAVLD
jgi:LCP family protein required for cell wall assembly